MGEMTDMTQIAMAHPIALSPQNSKMQQQWGSLRNLDLNNATVVEAVPQQQGAVAVPQQAKARRSSFEHARRTRSTRAPHAVASRQIARRKHDPHHIRTPTHFPRPFTTLLSQFIPVSFFRFV